MSRPPENWQSFMISWQDNGQRSQVRWDNHELKLSGRGGEKQVKGCGTGRGSLICYIVEQG